MSQADVDLLRSLYSGPLDLVEFVKRGGRGVAMEGIVTDETEFVWTASDDLIARRGMGVGGLIEGWRDWVEPYESYTFDVEGYIDTGDSVLMLVRFAGVTKRDKVQVEHSPAAMCTIRDGKLERMEFILERDDAFDRLPEEARPKT